jgi:hypothetical protein
VCLLWEFKRQQQHCASPFCCNSPLLAQRGGLGHLHWVWLGGLCGLQFLSSAFARCLRLQERGSRSLRGALGGMAAIRLPSLSAHALSGDSVFNSTPSLRCGSIVHSVCSGVLRQPFSCYMGTLRRDGLVLGLLGGGSVGLAALASCLIAVCTAWPVAQLV